MKLPLMEHSDNLPKPLGFNDAADLLATTLKEEKNADGKLFHLAVRVINVQVAQPGFF